MKSEAREIRLVFQMLLYLGLAVLAAAPVLAQVPVDENGNPVAPLEEGAAIDALDDGDLPLLSGAELEDLVGPVALYPDDLLAIVLPASSYPLQIVQAARFLEQLKTDPSLKPDEEWDDAVAALLNYPEVIELMNEDIDWTWRLGEAVVAQQPDVIAAIEAFRDKAYAAGNLKTDERQTVSNDNGVIEIAPVNEEVIYVPYYEPERVVVYQPQPVYHYYPYAYPLYYYPYPAGYYFPSGFFWGVTTAYSIGWWTHDLHVFHDSYWGHPYYGRPYYSHYYYRRPSLSVYNRYYVYNSHRYSNYRYRDGDYWRPRRFGGARPGFNSQRVHYYRDPSRDDWRHQGDHDKRDRRDGQQGDRNDQGGAWTRNRVEHSERSNDSRTTDRVDNNGGVRRGRDDGNALLQARNAAGDRSRINPGARRDSNASGSTARSDIQFRQRDPAAMAGSNRGSPRASEDLKRGSDLRTSFAARSGTSSAGSSVRRPVMSSPPQQANAPRRSASVRPGNAAAQRPPPQSQPLRSAAPRSAAPRSAAPRSAAPRSAAPRSAAPRNVAPRSATPARSSQRSAPQRSAPPPSAPRQNAAPPARSASRSSGAGSQESGQRNGARSKRH